ncbi:MAG: RNA polymerase sigma factor [Lysobacterales bacterium]
MEVSILQRISRGDASAVRECVHVYGARVWSVARRFSANAADAEDAVQEIFMAIWKSAGRFDPAKSEEGTFITMIARRRLIDAMRRKDIDTDSLDAWPNLAELNQGESPNSVEDSAEAASISALLKTFDSPQREVISMAIYGGYSHAAIAQHLGLPLGTAKSLLRRGMDRVRQLLNLATEEVV